MSPASDPAQAGLATPARRSRLPLLLLAAAAVVAAFVLLPVNEWLLATVTWVRDAGPAGVAVFALAYVAATVLLLPGSLLTLGAGFVWGPLLGTALVSPASVLAATASFLLGRSALRERVARRVASDARFAAVDEAVGRSGFRIVFLLRLSPVFPFNVLNYALGLTRVRLRDYVLASWLGMLPGTFLYVYLGSLATSAAELAGGSKPDAGPWGQVLLFGGLAATVAVTWVITRIARRALAASLESGGSRP